MVKQGCFTHQLTVAVSVYTRSIQDPSGLRELMQKRRKTVRVRGDVADDCQETVSSRYNRCIYKLTETDSMRKTCTGSRQTAQSTEAGVGGVREVDTGPYP